jgi:predicted dehydrogenase
MERVIRAGIVGLGVGERHAATYRTLPDVEVTAVCDIDPVRLREVADRQRVALRSEDYRTVTEHPDIDVVSICSYDEAHVEQAVSSLRHGKHVMIEKPVALTRRDAERLLEAQQEAGRIVTSNLVLRASPRFQALRAMIRAGEFGDVFNMEGDYLHQILWKITEGWRGRQSFYSTVFGGGIHLIDLMRWLLDDEVTDVCGMGTDLAVRGTGYRWPDTIVNLLRFEGGCLAKSMTSLAVQRPQLHALSIHGTRMSFVNDVPDGRLWWGDDPDAGRPMTEPYPGIEKGDLLPDFIDAVRQGREPNVTTRDVFRVMDICFAAWESVEAGHTVKVSYQV